MWQMQKMINYQENKRVILMKTLNITLSRKDGNIFDLTNGRADKGQRRSLKRKLLVSLNDLRSKSLRVEKMYVILIAIVTGCQNK